MFLLVSVRHVGAHPGGHQHGVSIQISKHLGKTFLRISRIRNILLTWILAFVFAYLPPFISQILDFIYYTCKGFCFLFWSILNGVTLRTRNMAVTGEKTLFSPATTILETRRHRGRGCGKPVVSTLSQKTAEVDTWPNFHTIQFSRKQKKLKTYF